MSHEPKTDAEARDTVTRLIRDAKICMLTTTTADGRQVSRPMGLQEAEFDGELWFFADADSAKVHQVERNPQVNVAFADQKNNAWVSISGTAEQAYDRAKAEQLWNPLLKAWFPDGLDTPSLTLLRVRASSAEYWNSPNGKVITLLGYAKAAVTGDRPEGGENREVSF
ncbi:pyridoxamine 5'-phosphate oxidase family protein [Plantactinospora sp. GCM10030261]|uniref:pyridoxamine 5'-phosphate oxidase family protein n=1 Tax=Plantactinospora sp. GCM10030261 TaxID=3273420 RepID=UPI00361BCE02